MSSLSGRRVEQKYEEDAALRLKVKEGEVLQRISLVVLAPLTPARVENAL